MGLVAMVCMHMKGKRRITIATYPSAGAWKGLLGWAKGASSVEGKFVESPPMFIRGKLQKTKMEKVKGLRILKWGFRSWEGISTPRACHKVRQPLIECANHDFNFIYFPFYLYFPFLFFTIFGFLCFFFYFFGVDKDVSLAPTYSSICDEEIRPT